jgi:hypothetical protein
METLDSPANVLTLIDVSWLLLKESALSACRQADTERPHASRRPLHGMRKVALRIISMIVRTVESQVLATHEEQHHPHERTGDATRLQTFSYRVPRRQQEHSRPSADSICYSKRLKQKQRCVCACFRQQLEKEHLRESIHAIKHTLRQTDNAHIVQR